MRKPRYQRYQFFTGEPLILKTRLHKRAYIQLTCHKCGKEIKYGDRLIQTANWKYFHVECFKAMEI